MADENAAAPAPAAPTEEVDEFAQVFAHLAEGGDPATDAGAGKPAAKLDAEGDAGDGGDGGAAAPAPAPAAPAPAPAAPAQAPAEAPPPAPPAPAPAPAPVAEAPAPAPAEFRLYTADEETQLADLAKEWPDIDKLIELKARKHAYELMTTVFAEMNKVITPMAAYVDHAVTDEHSSIIYEGVPDYDAVYAPFETWVGQQTGLKRKLLDTVWKEGSGDEIVEAINEFKAATAWKAATAPAAAPAPAAAASVAERTLSDAAKKAAAVLAPVNGKRSAMPTGGDPNDFDAAWEEAQKEA